MHVSAMVRRMNTRAQLIECSACPTRKLCVARFLDANAMAELPTVFETACTYQCGDHLFMAGDRVGNEYHVRSGCFKSYYIDQDGNETITRFYLPGEVVACAQMSGKHVQSCIATTTSTVCALQGESLDHTTSTALLAALYRHRQSNELDQLSSHLNIKTGSALARFAGFCMDMSTRLARQQCDANHIPTPMSRTDIASYLGLTLESLSRVVSKLKANGVIEANRQFVRILKPEALKTASAHLPSAL